MTIYPDIVLKPIDNDNFVIVEDCFVPEFSVIATKGAITDLTSSPWWLQWLIPSNGKAKKASIIHDYLVRYNNDRDYADSVYFYLLCKSVPSWQVILILIGLRVSPKIRNKYEKKNRKNI